jgi:hypothetical protein
MKNFLLWCARNKDSLLRVVFCIPIILSIIVSINHCIDYFKIANSLNWAIFLSISVEIAAFCTLIALVIGKPGFHIVLPFFIITIAQLLGNVFYSFHFIEDDDAMFQVWEKFIKTLFASEDEPWNTDMSKVWLSIIEGSIVPLLSLLSLHLISKFELKNKTLPIEEDKNKPDWAETDPESVAFIKPKPEIPQPVTEKVEPQEVKKTIPNITPSKYYEDMAADDARPLLNRIKINNTNK